MTKEMKELVEAVEKVCDPLFTASDGGNMWCAMRDRPGAKESVERLEAALAEARYVLNK